MTTLLGYHAPGAVYIATDGRSTANRSDIVTDCAEKVVIAGRWAIACSGTHSTVDALARAREATSCVLAREAGRCERLNS